MKKSCLLRNQFILTLLLACFAASLSAQQYSQLWGVDGELWDPQTSRLDDFTNVGYKGGDEPIPDWPVAHSVTDYGAIPNDGIDDSQAFIDAIAACPDYHAVLVPKGQFTILQKIEISNNDYFCLRGEDMYESVIFFPKKIGEVDIREIGFGSGQTPIYEFFFNFEGGTGKGVENLTFEFREQRMLGTWEYEGSGALSFDGGITDSWLRNVVILNYSSGIQVQSDYCSYINIIFDQYNARCGTDGVRSRNSDAYGSILVRNANYNLFHNISVDGYVLQPIDMNETSAHNVYSQYRSGERINRSASYHGGSSHFNLYTDLDKGVVQPKSSPSRSDETYWNVLDATHTDTAVLEEVYNSSNSLIFVGYGDDFAAKTNDPDLWYEPADFGQMTPNNLYLAQLDYFGEPIPAGFPASPPSPYAEDVFGIVAGDDTDLSEANNWYYRFDLTDANLPAVEHARLRVHVNSRQIPNPPYTFRAWSVTDDAWSEDTITPSNQPALVTQLDTRVFAHAEDNRVLEFDVTEFVRDQLVGGDGVVSLALDFAEGGVNPGLHVKEKGPRPELIIGRVADPVPGAPSAPRNFGTTPLVGNILLDWEDHPEPGVTYNVYRSPYLVNPDTGEYTYGYTEYIDTGLVTSDIADIQSSTNWRPGRMYHGVVYKYKVTAVDDHGYESPRSEEFYGATVHPSNDPPAFNTTVTLANATAWEAYNESLASHASDTESDPLHFHIVDGPAWLSVSQDGVLSGTPESSDVGTNSVTFQVTAIGGSMQKTVDIVVNSAPDNPSGAPAAPSDLAATASHGLVSLDWNDSTEADFINYSIYRSTTSGSGYTLFTDSLGSSDYADETVVNGTTYYYVVTAFDKFGNESLYSSEASASPVADIIPPAVPAGFSAALDAGAITLAWDANTESDLDRYTVYRSTTSNTYGDALITGLTTPNYTDTSVVDGITYYYVVTASDIYGNESPTSNEVSITFDADAFNALISGDFQVVANWSKGVLPTDPQDPGIINYDVSDGTWSANPASGLSIKQTGGSVSRSNFGWQTFSAMNYEITGGTFTAASWGLELKSGSNFTLSGGTFTVGDALNNNGSIFTMTGGTLNAKQLRATNGASYDFSGGTVNISGGSGSFTNSSGTSVVNFSGAIDFNANILGVSGTQNITMGTGTGTINVDTLDIASLSINWIPGSEIALTATNLLDSGVVTTWEAIWNSGQMTYNGSDYTTLGNWSVVSAADGLAPGAQFNFVSATGTLTLISPASSQPPAFTSDPVEEANATESVPYSATIADNASDPESDPMTFSKVAGPAWLNVSTNGDLSGTPTNGDIGLNSFTVQVEATGGSDTAVLEINVISAGDTTPPAAPVGLQAVPGDESASLDWNDNSEDDLASYNMYRSTIAGCYDTALASDVTRSNYIESTALSKTI